MGCACLNSKKPFEVVIDNVFATITVRKLTFDQILPRLEELEEAKVSPSSGSNSNSTPNTPQLNYITETNFQKFLNKYLLSDTLPAYNRSLFAYWMDVYHSKPSKSQLPLIKFALLCLCKSNTETDGPSIEDFNYFSSILSFYKQYRTLSKEDINGNNFTTVDDAFTLLKDYILIITQLTVEHFKYFDPLPQDFRESLTSLWTEENINDFVKMNYFSKIESFSSKVEVRKFVKKNWKLLKDDALIRKKLSDFSFGANRNKEDSLSLSETDPKKIID
jgi:hypothetical protein